VSLAVYLQCNRTHMHINVLRRTIFVKPCYPKSAD
jgi:hypothetical protein